MGSYPKLMRQVADIAQNGEKSLAFGSQCIYRIPMVVGIFE